MGAGAGAGAGAGTGAGKPVYPPQVKRDAPTVCLGEKVRDLWAAAERCSSTA